MFGPAYQRIPLASSVAMAFAEADQDYPVSFNRKEFKSHGEGGSLLGAPLMGQILAIDDVVTPALRLENPSNLLRITAHFEFIMRGC